MRRAGLWGAAAAACLAATAAQGFTKDSLVWKKCTSCHEAKNGVISRVEEIRTTPEEWTVIVDRMRRLHGMDLTAAEMDGLLKELCSTQILTPDEAAQVSYLALFNNPQHMEAPDGADAERRFAACVRCHSAGKIDSYRMNPASWAKIRDFHLWVDPAIVFQMREMHWIDEADAVLAALAKSHAYGQAWKAPAAKLAGKWLVLGREPGRGEYRGTAEAKDLGKGEWALSGSLAYGDGTSENFRGEATLYGGYALRTRTRHNGAETLGAYHLTGGVLRGEHHYPAPAFRTSQSTWYPLEGAARVLRVSPGYLLAGQETTLTLDGVGLPEVAKGDLAFSGATVEVLSARRVSPQAVEARVVYRGSSDGEAKVAVKGLAAGAVKLAAKIDRIAVTPATGRARLDGGPNYPAEGVQFEAVAYGAGDLALGPVPARFRLEEESTREGDDDLAWVGAIAAGGTFLPTGDYAPVPAREYQGEASGWVKVVAEYEHGGQTHRGEAKLAVTMPDFIQRIQ